VTTPICCLKWTWLEDSSSPGWPHAQYPFPSFPRRRVVLLLEDDLPTEFLQPDRFRKQNASDNRTKAGAVAAASLTSTAVASTDAENIVTAPQTAVRTDVADFPCEIYSCKWWWLSGVQKLPLNASRWIPYEPETQHRLTSAYLAERKTGCRDTASFDLSPMPYHVRWPKPALVTNRAVPELLGRQTFSSLPQFLWDVAPDQRPPLDPAHGAANAGHWRIVSGFAQVHNDDVELLGQFVNFLQDSNIPSWQHPRPRCRAVLCLCATAANDSEPPPVPAHAFVAPTTSGNDHCGAMRTRSPVCTVC